MNTAVADPTAPVGRAPEPVPIAAPPARLLSLDVFRGVTIAGMLVVNNPGTWSAIYPPLRHAEWHGWTPTDLIFPFFLFIVGVAITLSFSKQRARGADRARLVRKVVKRAAILFALGLILHGFPTFDLASIRIPGVLQRIAIAYLVTAFIVLYTGWRTQAGLAAALLLGYWALMTLVPVPGSGAGVLEPGRDLGAYLDRSIFGTEHLWVWSKTWDPEGLFSTVPAIASTLAGVLTGHWLRRARSAPDQLVGLFLAGNVAIVLGWIWSAAFPINKNLWTSSYVVFTTGLALNFLAMCYWLVDVRGFRRWAVPFVIFGTNAIAAYFLSSLFGKSTTLIKVPGPAGAEIPLKTYLFENLFASWLSPPNASLAYALCFTLLWLGAMAVLYRRRIFIKV